MVLALLEAFPGYTLATLREESTELLELLTIKALGNPQPTGGVDDGQ